MKTMKKNRFLTFCFSLLPGAGEMYMGFMRMGISLMLLFILMIFIPSVLGLEGLIPFVAIIWFYGFFHANHLVALSDEDFSQIEDKYLLGVDVLAGGKDFVQKYYDWIAGVLILAGVLLLWNGATDIMYNYFPVIYERMYLIGHYVPRVIVSFFIIGIGINMIRGRKKQLAKDEKEEA